MISVMICDDHAFTADGLRMLLETYNDIRVTGVAYAGEHLIELVALDPPDVVLMDLKMRGMTGIQAIRHLQRSHPSLPVIALTAYDQNSWVLEAIRSGAAGYLLKDSPTDQIVHALHVTAAGDCYLDPAVSRQVMAYVRTTHPPQASTLPGDLTSREVSILRAIGHGHSNSEIATELHLSEGTVKNYTTGLFRKLGVKDRTQAALKAAQYGL